MERPDQTNLELNEIRWWANWARLSWHGPSCYLLTSRELREPFFNRAGALSCPDVGSAAVWAEPRLVRLGMDSTVVVFDSCTRAIRTLENLGYGLSDRMAVLLSSGAMKTHELDMTNIGAHPSAGSWSKAYLEAFYGDQRLAARVYPIVRRMSKLKAVTLLEARIGTESTAWPPPYLPEPGKSPTPKGGR